MKKGVAKNLAKFTGKHLCQGLFFNKVAGNFIEKKTLAQVFSCEFSKNTFSKEHLKTTASEVCPPIKASVFFSFALGFSKSNRTAFYKYT